MMARLAGQLVPSGPVSRLWNAGEGRDEAARDMLLLGSFDTGQCGSS
jgi:hypothetical protein